MHVDEDDGDILVAGLAAWIGMEWDVLVRNGEDERKAAAAAAAGRQAGEITIW